jgi:hypothetical protein
MKRNLPFGLGALSLVLALALDLAGCATIMKGSDQKISFSSDPSSAKVTIFDSAGTVVADGKTPLSLPLKKGAGFFQAAKYRVVFEHPGMEKKEVWLSGSLEGGWYVLGNFLVGGLIGWLIIDPLSGAMWNLQPDPVNVRLDPKLSSLGAGLTIALAQDLSPELLARATPIGQD